MFAFTLGTSPVFFLVAYLATQIGARLEKAFIRFVAIVVLLLGLYTFDGGLNLMGQPPVSGAVRQGFPAAASTTTAPKMQEQPGRGVGVERGK